MLLPFSVMMRHSRDHWAFRHGSNRQEASWLIVVCLALFCAGCGQSATGNVAHLPTQPATPAAKIHCGAITAALGAGTTSDPKVLQAEACFIHAYARCDRADLVFTTIAVDVGVIHTFRLQPAGTICMVNDTAQGYSANFGGSHGPLRFYACAGLAQQDGGLLIRSCGTEGNIFVPAPK